MSCNFLREGDEKQHWRGGPIFEVVFIFSVIFIFDVVFIVFMILDLTFWMDKLGTNDWSVFSILHTVVANSLNMFFKILFMRKNIQKIMENFPYNPQCTVEGPKI